MERPAVFLDKDGTLLEDVPFNVDPERMRLAPRAADALRLLGSLDVPLIVISNQSGVALDKFELGALYAVQAHLEALFTEQGAHLTGFYTCPHHPQGTVAIYAVRCACRKPQPGMLYLAAALHAVDLSRSWLVGDILDDVEAGNRSGCKTVLVDNGNETLRAHGPFRTPDLIVGDLFQAACAISRTFGPRKYTVVSDARAK
ncbi:D-glycero-alpha-D-manno-heptose-1,7-bisphosphate 7-phosphatase [Pararobbsia alpina]|uniref:D,D-heptose 1,7-bisphosphate phosphatase n=1 Tax=Pararobbsia alpina TaxID=621374 RepID=A0A6S7BHQ2_9BURK|nr:HAD-IIIA family hydrolase [Pararobbsia alpina]CAB3800693.1 Histidine biosynthesis bifunctional protein HisB [Pararobbsia alpina]